MSFILQNIRHIEEEHNVPLSDMFRDVDAVTFYSFIKLVNFFRRDVSLLIVLFALQDNIQDI